MQLGAHYQINVGVADMALTAGFWRLLGFQPLGHGDEPAPWVQLTDGQILVMLSQDPQAYTGLTYFAPDMPARAEAAQRAGVQFRSYQEHEGELLQAIFISPEGLPVSLVRYEGEYVQPTGRSNPRCGQFGELSLPTADLEASLNFWRPLGFATLHWDREPNPWAIISDGAVILGLHQTKEFYRPALTYFAPDMAGRIEALKEAGLPFLREMPDGSGDTANGILEGPSGQLFFLFQGMLSER